MNRKSTAAALADSETCGETLCGSRQEIRPLKTSTVRHGGREMPGEELPAPALSFSFPPAGKRESVKTLDSGLPAQMQQGRCAPAAGGPSPIPGSLVRKKGGIHCWKRPDLHLYKFTRTSLPLQKPLPEGPSLRHCMSFHGAPPLLLRTAGPRGGISPNPAFRHPAGPVFSPPAGKNLTHQFLTETRCYFSGGSFRRQFAGRCRSSRARLACQKADSSSRAEPITKPVTAMFRPTMPNSFSNSLKAYST